MDFDKICMMFTMEQPYYGIILSSMNKIPDTEHRCTNTMAVTKRGNVFCLYYNPAFVGQLDVTTTLELLKHEILHLAFSHFDLWETPNPTPAVQRLRNIAADLEVNCYLKRENVGIHILYAEDFGWAKELGTREYYKLLVQEAKKQQALRKPKSIFDGMTKLEKRCLRLNRFKKMNVRQIAQELNLPVQRIKKNLKSARQKIKNKIVSYGL